MKANTFSVNFSEWNRPWRWGTVSAGSPTARFAVASVKALTQRTRIALQVKMVATATSSTGLGV